MKKWLCIALTLTMALACALASAEGTALTWDELAIWGSSILELTKTTPTRSETSANVTDDGYGYAFDYATVYCSTPEVTDETIISAVQVDAAQLEAPHGVRVGMTVEEVLALFPNSNPNMAGAENAALIYMVDQLPEIASWGIMYRNGQNVEMLEFGVHEPVTAGGTYCSAGLVCTVSANRVSAIRVYGLDSTRMIEEVKIRLDDITALTAGNYERVRMSVYGGDLDVVTEADLTLNGHLLTGLTIDQAKAAFGAPNAESKFENGTNGYIISCSWDGFELTWLTDAAEKNATLAVVDIYGINIDGPRAMRIGDTLESCINRVRNGEGEFDTDTLTQMLYGTRGEGNWGTVNYGLDYVNMELGTQTSVGQAMVSCLYEDLKLSGLYITFEK